MKPYEAPMKSVKLGILQVDHTYGEAYELRIKKLLALAEECLAAGAELIAFPEAYQHTTDRSVLTDHQRLLALNDSWKAECASLARRYHAYVVPWDYEAREDGGVSNCSYILDRNGEEIGRYRKCHLTRDERDELHLIPGGGFPVFDLDFGKVGIMICYDNYFPESARLLGNAGADLILYPLYADGERHWEAKVQARAMDNSTYVMPIQLSTGSRNHYSYSGLIAPGGDVICHLTERQSFAVCRVTVGKTYITHLLGDRRMEENLPRILSVTRRPDLYGRLADPTTEYSREEIGNY